MSQLTVTTIQSILHWENIDENLKMFGEKISSLQEKTEVVILPEMFSTGFSNNTSLAETMDGKSFQWMKDTAQKKNIVLIGSVMIKENEQFFNRCICMLPNGQYGQYDKRHLFPLSKENENFVPGSKRLICSVKGWKLYIQICYDLRFPVWAAQQMKDSSAEYDIFINVANWPVKRITHWKTLLQARAIENQCYAIGVNRTGTDGYKTIYNGNSSIYSPLGEVIYQKEKEEDVFTTILLNKNIDDVRSTLPYLQDSDLFIIH